MSGPNGRRFGEARITDAGLIVPPGLDTQANEPEGVTIEQWLKKSDRSVNRAELAAFADVYMMTKMKAVLAYVLDKRMAELRGEMADMILDRERWIRGEKWYRRLGRWIATFGHRPVVDGGLTPEQLAQLKAEFQGQQQKADVGKTPPEIAHPELEQKSAAPLRLEQPTADAPGE